MLAGRQGGREGEREQGAKDMRVTPDNILQ